MTMTPRMKSAASLVALSMVLGVGGCKRRASDDGQTTKGPMAQKLAPLQGQRWLESIPVPGYGEASVAIPLGATQPRPVLIAIHGAADRPEWQCGTWRAVTPVPFILCPRGQKAESQSGSERFTFQSSQKIEGELKAGLAALKKRFGEYVAKGSVVVGAFGRGADLVLPVVGQEPTFFSKVVLIEGGAERWSSSFATLFADSGAERVLFACGRPSCGATAERAVTWSKRAGLDGRLVYAGPIGPYWDSRLAGQVGGAWQWLVGDDPRWTP